LNVVSLTPAAADEIRVAQSEKGIAGFGLRVQVVGGGCEGFLYDLLYVDGPDPEDQVFETQGQRVFVDPRSLAAVDGLTIDHGKTPYGMGFLFDNPRAHGRCSCGASFST
jgi:iron-sulfur cluster assembly accessory protein